MKLENIISGIVIALFISFSLSWTQEVDDEFDLSIEPLLLRRSRRQLLPSWTNWFGIRSNSKSPVKSATIKKNFQSFAHPGNYSQIPQPFRPTTEMTTERDPRFLSLFNLVKFDNAMCSGSNGDNGTCFPSSECTRRGGTPNGRCAQGYGVCCIFSRTCGQSTNQNFTYFTNSPGYNSASAEGTGSCQLTIYKSARDICQLKLEFDNFVIAQPSQNGLCQNDQFIVSGSNTAVPIICGINTGNHMYLDIGVDNSPVTLSVVTSGPTFSRSWKIKILQMNCYGPNKAPGGCLQHYSGVSGVIRSYNFDFTGGQQLSNQDYTACIRVERNFCGIRYTACTDTNSQIGNNINSNAPPRSRSFSLTGQITAQQGSLVGSNECRTDWVTIPCATNTGRITQAGNTVCQDRICGDTFNSETSQIQQPVFSFAKPFRIVYHTDDNENNDTGNRGFCLSYIQQPCVGQNI